MIEEPHREVRDEGPGLAHVVGHGQAAVVAGEDMCWIVRIDPDGVNVVVCGPGGIGHEGLAAVDGHVQPDATEIERSASVGSMTIWLKYMGRGLVLLMWVQLWPPSSER